MDLPLFAAFEPKPRRSHHVRRPIPGRALEAAQEIAKGERKANEQEAAVLAFYRENPGAWSPSEVWLRVGPRDAARTLQRDSAGLPSRILIGPGHSAPGWPITSVRRAITNLSDEKRYPSSRPPLRITMERVPSPFGGKEFRWTLNERGVE